MIWISLRTLNSVHVRDGGAIPRARLAFCLFWERGNRDPFPLCRNR